MSDTDRKDDRSAQPRRDTGSEVAELARILAEQDAQIHEMLKRT